MTNPFEPDVIAAITRHMNHDHGADTLVMCRGTGGHPTATAARMDGFDATGGDFVVTVDDTELPCRIAWAEPLSERKEVRPEIVRIYQESRALLGLDD
ncbi:DUF2470 domain-containing protein [Stackebrandtia soli]|uniref:DUF2470 domain-containing protein n=1 Tax=Stackebrandtia soli TaxID=1892856 RepID=UPI0039ECC68D